MPKQSIIGGLSVPELEIVQEILAPAGHLERAQLFGSRAMNTHRPTSDVDLALFGEKLTRSDVNSLKIAFEDSTLPYTFDLIQHETIKEPELLAHIQRRGVDVFRKGFYLSEEGEWVPEGWDIKTVQALIDEKELIIGDGYRAKNSELAKSGDYPFARAGNISGGFSFQDAEFLCTDSEKYVGNKRSEIGDVVFTSKGTVGRFAKVDKQTPQFVYSPQICFWRSSAKLVNSDWLFYAMSSNWLGGQMKWAAGQTDMADYISLKDQKTFNLWLPDPMEQKAIAAVLGSLDDKIELLREQNETLEALAQTLFKRWFIDFNFPDENGNPYKDSGGNMIASELGEIPEGWKVAKLKNFGAIVCGKTPSKAKAEYFGVDVPFIKIPDMHGNTFINVCGEYLSHAGADSQRKKTVPANSILVSCIATVGLVSMTIRDSQTNQQINAIVPNRKIATEYLYLRIKTLYDFLQNLGAGGSATLNINTSSFSEVEVVRPAQCQLEKFHSLTGKLFTKIKINSEQIQTLTQLRDTLLPKLMKGEIRIKPTEK